MTSERLGEMFEGDLQIISACLDGEPSGGSSLCRPGSEDPHWRELKFLFISNFSLA